MRKTHISHACIALVLVLSLAGCTAKMGGYHPSSHFAFPNSNVTVLGPVSAESQRVGFLSAPPVDKEFIDEVYNKALANSGGDMIVDYKFDTTMTMIFPILIMKLELSGMAAKHELGMQKLK